MTLTSPSKPQIEGEMEGFVIKEVEMYKFMRYLQKTTIPFHTQFTVIAGQTGHGKTTILDAITFALYRRTSRTDLKGVNIEDICGNSGYAKVTFSHKGATYSVKRGRNRTGKSTLTLERNGQRVEGTIPELDAQIESIIGLDYVGFRNSTFIRQDEMRALGAEIGSRRLEIFQKLFRLEVFEKVQALADQQQRITRETVFKMQGAIESFQKQLQNLPKLVKEKTGLEKEIQTLNSQLKAVISKLDEVETHRAKLQKKHDEFVRLEGLEEETEENIKQLVTKLRNAAKSQAQVKILQSEVEQLIESTKDYETISDQIKSLSIQVAEQTQKKKSLEEQKKQFEQNMAMLAKRYEARKKNLSARLELQEKRVTNLEKTTLDKDEAFDVLRNEGMLNERLIRIEKELKWLSDNIELIQELKKERVLAQTQLGVIQEKTGQINQDSFVLSEIRDQITQIKDDLEKTEMEYTQEMEFLQKNLGTIEETRKTLKDHEEDLLKLSALEQLAKEKRKKRELLEKRREELKDFVKLPGLVASLDHDLQEKRKALKKIKDEKSRLEQFENEFEQIQETFSVLRDQQENFRAEIAEKAGIMKKIMIDIKDLEELAQNIHKKETELKESQNTLEIFTILKENIFHKTGVPMHAIQQLLPLISREASMNLGDLTDKRLTQMRLTPYIEGGAYGIKIEVAGTDNRWMDVQEFSGGEKTQINGALRLAIAKELARMPQIGRTYGQMRTLFIDEGDLGSLDTEISRTLFIQKLFDQGEFFQKIILITHLTDLIDMFPGKIRIYMTPTGESRVEIREVSN